MEILYITIPVISSTKVWIYLALILNTNRYEVVIISNSDNGTYGCEIFADEAHTWCRRYSFLSKEENKLFWLNACLLEMKNSEGWWLVLSLDWYQYISWQNLIPSQMFHFKVCKLRIYKSDLFCNIVFCSSMSFISGTLLLFLLVFFSLFYSHISIPIFIYPHL